MALSPICGSAPMAAQNCSRSPCCFAPTGAGSMWPVICSALYSPARLESPGWLADGRLVWRTAPNANGISAEYIFSATGTRWEELDLRAQGKHFLSRGGQALSNLSPYEHGNPRSICGERGVLPIGTVLGGAATPGDARESPAQMAALVKVARWQASSWRCCWRGASCTR